MLFTPKPSVIDTVSAVGGSNLIRPVLFAHSHSVVSLPVHGPPRTLDHINSYLVTGPASLHRALHESQPAAPALSTQGEPISQSVGVLTNLRLSTTSWRWDGHRQISNYSLIILPCLKITHIPSLHCTIKNNNINCSMKNIFEEVFQSCSPLKWTPLKLSKIIHSKLILLWSWPFDNNNLTILLK